MDKKYTTIEEWQALSLPEKQQLLRTPGDSRRLNPVRKTIEWADLSLNYVTGCKNGCKTPEGKRYCYAEKIAARKLYDQPPFDQPAIWPERLERLTQNLDQVSGKRIFWGSAADIFGDWIPAAWLEAMVDAIAACDAALTKRGKSLPTHIFLTKNPIRYSSLELRDLWLKPNVWFGATVDTQERWLSIADDLFELADQYAPSKGRVPNIWLSIEPLLSAIDLRSYLRMCKIKQIVIGPQTGAGAKPPERQWVESILDQVYEAPQPIAVWVKNNLGYHLELKRWYDLNDRLEAPIGNESDEV